MESILNSRFPVSLQHVVNSHGWINLEPWKWDGNENGLSRVELLPDGQIARVKVTQQTPKRFLIDWEGESQDQLTVNRLRYIVSRWLSLEWDPRPAVDVATNIDSLIAEHIVYGGGRFLRCSSFYEDFVKTICTINTNWKSTVRMVSSLVNKLGCGVFPTPLRIMESGEKVLREEIRLGFRSKVVSQITSRLLHRQIINYEGDLIVPVTHNDLLGLSGIGPYSANHLMVLENDFSRIPIDSEVSDFCKKALGIQPDEIEGFYDHWGAFRFLGYKLGRILRHSG
jgi:endonuclease III